MLKFIVFLMLGFLVWTFFGIGVLTFFGMFPKERTPEVMAGVMIFHYGISLYLPYRVLYA